MSTLQTICSFIRDLTDYDSDKILVGRTNYEKYDTSSDIIVVDYMSSVPLATSTKFDGNVESMAHGAYNKYQCSVDFHGNNATANATKFMTLLNSDSSATLQKEHNIRVGHSTNITNLRELRGTIYNDVYQVEIEVIHHNEVVIPTLRIDEGIIATPLVN